MKKSILTVVGCLLLGAATTLASNELVIHLHSGSALRYVLLDEEPTISFSGDNIVVKTLSTETVYAMDSVAYFNYENAVVDAIETVGADGLRIDGELIALSGLPAGSKVQLYGVGGRLYLTTTADAEGKATVALTKLPAGVYILNAANISTKITKK